MTQILGQPCEFQVPAAPSTPVAPLALGGWVGRAVEKALAQLEAAPNATLGVPLSLRELLPDLGGPRWRGLVARAAVTVHATWPLIVSVDGFGAPEELAELVADYAGAMARRARGGETLCFNAAGLDEGGRGILPRQFLSL